MFVSRILQIIEGDLKLTLVNLVLVWTGYMKNGSQSKKQEDHASYQCDYFGGKKHE